MQYCALMCNDLKSHLRTRLWCDYKLLSTNGGCEGSCGGTAGFSAGGFLGNRRLLPLWTVICGGKFNMLARRSTFAGTHQSDNILFIDRHIGRLFTVVYEEMHAGGLG